MSVKGLTTRGLNSLLRNLIKGNIAGQVSKQHMTRSYTKEPKLEEFVNSTEHVWWLKKWKSDVYRAIFAQKVKAFLFASLAKKMKRNLYALDKIGMEKTSSSLMEPSKVWWYHTNCLTCMWQENSINVLFTLNRSNPLFSFFHFFNLCFHYVLVYFYI